MFCELCSRAPPLVVELRLATPVVSRQKAEMETTIFQHMNFITIQYNCGTTAAHRWHDAGPSISDDIYLSIQYNAFGDQVKCITRAST